MNQRVRFAIALGWLGLWACGSAQDRVAVQPLPNAPPSASNAGSAPTTASPGTAAPSTGLPAGQTPAPASSSGVIGGAPAPVTTTGGALAGAPAGPDPASPSAGPSPAAFNPYPDFKSDFYADDKAWACKPGAANDACLTGLEATEVLPDGTTKPAPEPAPGERAIDCLYFYPTVSRSAAQSSRDFSSSQAILDVTRSQAGRFTRVCNLYVPFYRLVSLENATGGDIDLAYGDVLEAFKHYLANFSEGRDFVLIGHSQGSNHGLKLLKEEIDDRPELRKRMVAALMLGFPVQLPMGQAMGGSFKNIPICQSDAQRGCLVNYMSFTAQNPPPSNSASAGFGAIEVCTNPAALGGGPGLFQGTYFPAAGWSGASTVSTPWVLFRDYFRGECKRTSAGTAYLEIAPAQQPGDQRMFGVLREISGIGLHVMDFTFSQGDLIELIAKQAALKP